MWLRPQQGVAVSGPRPPPLFPRYEGGLCCKESRTLATWNGGGSWPTSAVCLRSAPSPPQPVLLVVVGLPPRGHAGAVRPPLALLMCLTIAPHPHHLALLALRYGYRPLGREWRGGGQSKDAAPGSSGAGVRVGHRCGATVWRIDPQTHQSPAQGALENPLLSPIKEHWGSSVLLTGGGEGGGSSCSVWGSRTPRQNREVQIKCFHASSDPTGT